MAIIEQTTSQIAGIDVQPIVNHGKQAWRIYKPKCDGDYICQFNASLAAITISRWASVPTSLPDLIERLQGMHE